MTGLAECRTSLAESCVELLARWSEHARANWHWLKERDQTDNPIAGYYGTGYGGWGISTQAGAVSALAVLSAATGRESFTTSARCGLRFLLGAHVTGPLTLADGEKWGGGMPGYRNELAALSLVQALVGIDLNPTILSDYDRTLVQSIVVTETERYIHDDIAEGRHLNRTPIFHAATGALLLRAAIMYTGHQHAGNWFRQGRLQYSQALAAWQNGSLDINSLAETMCVLAACGLAFLQRGKSLPATPPHHWDEDFSLLQALQLGDGALAFVGGQDEPRFSAGQAYALPLQIWAALQNDSAEDFTAAAAALAHAKAVLNLLADEQAAGSDGAFYGWRLADLHQVSEWDYFRWEAATAWALATAYALLTLDKHPNNSLPLPGPANVYKSTAMGVVWHRSPQRLATWAWPTGHKPTQGLVLPVGSGSIAEWNGNMVGQAKLKEHQTFTSLQYHREYEFAGGFATLGLLAEQTPDWPIVERTPSLRHGLAFWALPDEQTCVLLDLLWTVRQVTLLENRGLLYRLAAHPKPRLIRAAQGNQALHVDLPPTWQIKSPWLTIDDNISFVSAWGGSLVLTRQSRYPAPHQRRERAGRPGWDVCLPLEVDSRIYAAGEVVRDAGAACFCGALVHSDAGAVAQMAVASLPFSDIAPETKARAATLLGADGLTYVLAVNFDKESATLALPEALHGWRLLAGNMGAATPGYLRVPPASLLLAVTRQPGHE